MYPGTTSKIEFKKAAGSFGGIFATEDRAAAKSHGDILYRVNVIGDTLTNYELNYGIDGAYAVAMSVCRESEIIADAAMNLECPDCCDENGIEWDGLEIQKFRGMIAAALGFGAIEMCDEHGITYLVVNCEVLEA